MIIPTSQIKKPKLRKVKQHVHGYTANHHGAGIQIQACLILWLMLLVSTLWIIFLSICNWFW